MTDRYRGALLGLAVGDALGTAVEFSPPGTFAPITDMVGGGPFKLQPGQWTDDTSMALCLAVSLVECGGFNARDQMDRYCRWTLDGYMSSTGQCFDVGLTVHDALSRYQQTGDPMAGSTDEGAAGNGSLMRLAPVVLFYHPDRDAAILYAAHSSKTTHGATECVDACRLMASMICRALDGEAKSDVLFGDASTFTGASKIEAIARGDYRAKAPPEIRGTGYVVESLEAALWCVHTTESFESAVLRAVNLGHDADTTAAICGQLAGAMYGVNAIPEKWREVIAMRAVIEQLATTMATSIAPPSLRTGPIAGV
jgi:ADP-ribosyl-[dinitrogen reductase] hydrolase